MTSKAKTSIRNWLPRYWWDVRSLASALREGTLTEREKFAYVFVWLWVPVVCLLLVGWGTETFVWTTWDIASELIGTTVAGIGVLHSFNINQAGDNRHYLERLCCLLFLATIRTGVYFSPLTAVVLLTTNFAEEEAAWFSFTFPIALNLAVFWQVCRWMRWVAHGTPDPVNGDASQSR